MTDQPTTSDEAVRDWLHRVMKQVGLKPTPLAKAAGLAPSTLLRALDPANPGSLERRSIDKIVQTFGVPPPVIYPDARTAAAAPGFGEPEVSRVPKEPAAQAKTLDPMGFAIAPTQGDWTVHTRAVELAGYVPGDRVRADSAATARPRDVVIAQVVDQARGTAETVLRVYDPPYLLTETADPAARRKPLLVDNDRVSIWGVVVRCIRTRRDEG